MGQEWHLLKPGGRRANGEQGATIHTKPLCGADFQPCIRCDIGVNILRCAQCLSVSPQAKMLEWRAFEPDCMGYVEAAMAS
jgi:hypothetical protein